MCVVYLLIVDVDESDDVALERVLYISDLSARIDKAKEDVEALQGPDPQQVCI